MDTIASLNHGDILKNRIGLGRADRVAQGFQPQGPPVHPLRHAGDSFRLPGPEDTSVHPWGKPMSHSTQSGFKATVSDTGFSRLISCAERLAEGELFRKADGFSVER